MSNLPSSSFIPNSGSPVYFFGCGPLLEACFEEICELVGRSPDGLLDPNPTKIGQPFMGWTCESPQVLARHERPVVVVTARRHWPIERAALAVNPGAQLLHVVFQPAFHKAVRVCTGLAASPVSPDAQLACDFSGARALVTGATRGIGRILATRLAIQGFDLVIAGRDEGLLREVVQELRAYGVDVAGVCADLGNEEGLRVFLEHPAVTKRPVDLVFNNAGVASPDRAILDEPVAMRDMLGVYAVNVVAPIAIAEHFLRLSSRSRPVRIVFLTSNLSSSLNTTYTVTKTALHKYVGDSEEVYRGLDAALYLLDPGDMRTPMNPHGIAQPESVFPAAWLPLYCRSRAGGGVIHATEFAGMDLDEAVRALIGKYSREWEYWPLDSTSGSAVGS